MVEIEKGLNMEAENYRADAQLIVDKIVEAERLGGGFRSYFANAVNIIEQLMSENVRLKQRVKALDDLQASTVQR